MPLMAPTREEIEDLARAAIDRLPEPFRRYLDDVVLHVADFPDDDTLAEMGLESPFDLLGLYRGHPVGSTGAEATGRLPPTIFLYRRPLLDVWAEGEESLEALVTHVLVHEVGHHFGLSDAEMEAIEARAQDA
ncbi:MAG: metallopeptidase family protein [Sphingomonadaceae bacterium]|uniref:metallopeptidase family protein n=1 Tax=Thermaurantiacus sp. TaxID=2820283 RepID=UPI00298EFDA7|nr:metallopeptidase family protein [Thermaurantiacus sp.]MCS6986267.1 metallopeptidase family protein [Sphingomonadaceae bacterium]MDW8415716.1 metallopeptidase family protein [Thermaurantiacus sp.]